MSQVELYILSFLFFVGALTALATFIIVIMFFVKVYSFIEKDDKK